VDTISVRSFGTAVFVVAVMGMVLWVNAGDLNPPAGPVAPTMKTLAQVEPRTAVNSTNTPGDTDAIFVISQSGSYYLEGNINLTTISGSPDGIRIEADNVTLDLSGFALTGIPGSSHGISVASWKKNITIRNGTVAGFPRNGIAAGSAYNCILDRLHLSDNGWRGLTVGMNSIVMNCAATNNQSFAGFELGYGGIMRDCIAKSNGVDGILAYTCTISGCTATANGDNGIQAENCLLRGNLVRGNTAVGFNVFSCRLIDNFDP